MKPYTDANFHFITVKNREFAEQDIKPFLTKLLLHIPLVQADDPFEFFRLCYVIHDMESPLSALSEDMRKLA